MSETIRAFEPTVPQDAVDDLRRRLHNTRWIERETVGDLGQGVPLVYLQELCSYWGDDYDFEGLRSRLRRHAQILTQIDGLEIHALHVPSPHPEATPLLLTHGWPGSFLEFAEVVDPLADPVRYGGEPADAFHVVCPSLPGYGFSGKPAVSGWNVPRTADAWVELMGRLGYRGFLAQGGDWGSMVTTHLAFRHPEQVLGIHLNMAVAGPPPGEQPTAEEAEVIARNAAYQKDGSGYLQIQGTRPQTIGYGIGDSPAAQAAWIVEKLWAWTDNQGHVEDALSKEQILDLVSLYWFTATGASSARLYWETFRHIEFETVQRPVAISQFPGEIIRTTKPWAAAVFPDLRYYRETERGGHFAALEQPELFVSEMRAAAPVLLDRRR